MIEMRVQLKNEAHNPSNATAIDPELNTLHIRQTRVAGSYRCVARVRDDVVRLLQMVGNSLGPY